MSSVTKSPNVAVEGLHESTAAAVDYPPERVRADSRRFILIAGHEIPDVEVVVERTDAYVIVEKVGVAGDVAEATDPR